jgi:hypothetical protein
VAKVNSIIDVESNFFRALSGLHFGEITGCFPFCDLLALLFYFYCWIPSDITC